jgi:hypothetical protein
VLVAEMTIVEQVVSSFDDDWHFGAGRAVLSVER